MRWPADSKDYPLYLRTRIRKGCGCGIEADYVPWHNVRDIPSRGTSGIPGGVRVDRPFHLLSEYEKIYFMLMERRPRTVDIREQFPILDIKRSLEFCASLGLTHKRKGAYPEPFTIDFLITEQGSSGLHYRAASVKPQIDDLDEKAQLTLRLEMLWCAEKSIPWTLVDPKRFGDTKVTLQTLHFLRAWHIHHFQPVRETCAAFAAHFLSIYKRNVPLIDLIGKTAKHMRLSRDDATDMFRFCGWAKYIDVSVVHPMVLNAPLFLNTGRA